NLDRIYPVRIHPALTGVAAHPPGSVGGRPCLIRALITAHPLPLPHLREGGMADDAGAISRAPPPLSSSALIGAVQRPVGRCELGATCSARHGRWDRAKRRGVFAGDPS